VLCNDEKIDPRVKRTRQLLQQALNSLIQEQEFQSITVLDIAARAEVNRATFYAHFEDKYALLNYSMRESLNAMLEANWPDKPPFTLDNLRLLAMTVAEFVGKFFDHCMPTTRQEGQFLMASQVHAHLNEILARWIEHTQPDIAQRGISAEHAAQVLSWVIFGSVMEWARTERKKPPTQMIDEMLTLLSTGIHELLVEPVA
jgi:AcrR family transcriptional regulator